MKRKLLHLLFFTALAGLMFLKLLTAAAAAPEESGEELRITVIDVGKGDCIVTQTAGGTVMIDTGYEDTTDRVLSWLSEHGVEKLDVLIISHFDKDHVGGAAEIIRKVPIGRVYLPDYAGTSKKYKNMMAALAETKVPYGPVSEASGFRTGDAQWEMYPSGVAFDGDNDNDCSLAVSVRLHGRSALFAGDLEEDGIRDFAKQYGTLPSFDILKMPHHGSNEDNTADLLDIAEPKIALITDGQSRRASGKTLDLLEERKAEVYSSAEKGTITVTGRKNGGYTVQTEITEQPGTFDRSGRWRYELSKDKTAVITGHKGEKEVLSIPVILDGYPVTGIGASAFYNCRGIRQVSIPEGVTDIGASAFSWCTDLEEARLPRGLRTLGESAFGWCYSLENIVIPDSVRLIPDAAFTRSGLKEATVPADVESIGDSSFSHCKKLATIHFKGSGERWEQIKKDKDWNKKSKAGLRIEFAAP